MSAATKPMTLAEFLAIPPDGRRRWLIKGELREELDTGGPDLTTRNRFHSAAMANTTGELYVWRSTRPRPWGQVVCGEAGVILPGDPETTVGVDVAYVSADVRVRQSDETTLVEGVPTLVVEILSPSTTIEQLDEKLDAYAEAGVPLVWVIHPRRRTVTIYRPHEEPTLVNDGDELTGGDILPGFRVPVARLFE
jgi:Uma2 family endonuclease